MAKYKKGQTSKEVQLKKESITQSIVTENSLLSRAIKTGQLPKSLQLSNGKITLGNVQQWHDEKLQVLRYSSNTGTTKDNAYLTADLKLTIQKLNIKLKQGTTSAPASSETRDRSKTKIELESEISKLKKQAESLKRTVAEIYRAYKQITHTVLQEQQDSEKYRTALRKQAEEMAHKILRVVK